MDSLGPNEFSILGSLIGSLIILVGVWRAKATKRKKSVHQQQKRKEAPSSYWRETATEKQETVHLKQNPKEESLSYEQAMAVIEQQQAQIDSLTQSKGKTVVHQHHYSVESPAKVDHSGSGSWGCAGLFLGAFAIPLALLIDISSNNSGGRTIAALKGFALAILFLLALEFAGYGIL